MHITTVYNLDNLDRSTNGNERRQKYRRTWRILCYYILCYYEWTYFQNICQHIHRRQVTSRPCSMYRARSCIEINRSSWPPYIYIVRPGIGNGWLGSHVTPRVPAHSRRCGWLEHGLSAYCNCPPVASTNERDLFGKRLVSSWALRPAMEIGDGTPFIAERLFGNERFILQWSSYPRVRLLIPFRPATHTHTSQDADGLARATFI